MLKNIIEEGLQIYNGSRTQRELGDRETYIGASDLSGCARKAVLQKHHKLAHDLETLMKFERGHLAEDIIANALDQSKYPITRQKELSGATAQGTPLKFHLDFVFESQTHLSVLEVKSCNGLPKSPYGAWELQLYAQMGAVAAKKSGKTISGTLLALDLNTGEIEVWGQYKPSESITNMLWDKADAIWAGLKSVKDGEELPDDFPVTLSPICGFCDFLSSCPRFKSELVPELEEEADEIVKLKQVKKRVEKEIKNKEEPFKKMIEDLGKPIQCGRHKIKLAHRKRTNTDMKALKLDIEEAGFDISQYQSETQYSFLEWK